MTLATQCPYCKTSFRISEAQLAQHKGVVRCGVCSQVFNGNDFLQKESDATSAAAPESAAAPLSPITAVKQSDPIPPITGPAFSVTPEVSPEMTFEPEKLSPDVIIQEPDLVETPVDHDWDMHTEQSLSDETHVKPIHMDAVSPQQDTEPVLLEETENITLNDSKEDAEAEGDFEQDLAPTAASPRFIEQGRRREKRRRILNWLMGLCSAVLLLAALIQAAFFWRHQIIAAAPATKLLYSAACKQLHCSIGLATQIDELSLESNDLQAVPDQPNTYQLQLIIRNNSKIPQTWPHIELSLNSQADTPLVRRVFTPQEYLGMQELVDTGLMNQMEQPISVKFTLPEGTPVSGYRVYLFYP